MRVFLLRKISALAVGKIISLLIVLVNKIWFGPKIQKSHPFKIGWHVD